jgi:hypothetical protein
MNGAEHNLPVPQGLSSELFTMFVQQQLDLGLEKINDSVVRGSWNQHEDELLIQAVSQLGTSKWMDVAKLVPSRTSKQCRERWFNRLSPNLKRDPFELWEDQMIVERQMQLGNRWSLIAQSLPGRSPGAVKNRWYAGLRSGQTGPMLHVMEHCHLGSPIH